MVAYFFRSSLAGTLQDLVINGVRIALIIGIILVIINNQNLSLQKIETFKTLKFSPKRLLGKLPSKFEPFRFNFVLGGLVIGVLFAVQIVNLGYIITAIFLGLFIALIFRVILGFLEVFIANILRSLHESELEINNYPNQRIKSTTKNILILFCVAFVIGILLVYFLRFQPFSEERDLKPFIIIVLPTVITSLIYSNSVTPVLQHIILRLVLT